MPFDLSSAMRISGNAPDMYENQSQAMSDMRAQAASDPEMRRRMVTERARNWYRSYMGKEPPALNISGGMPVGIVDPHGQQLRGILAQLRQAGMIG